MRKLLLVFALTFSSMFLYAQTFNVKGVVTDVVTGETLLGVNVIVKNSSRGDVTDFDGNYKISAVPKGSILVFSYLGYKTKEVVVDKETINVALEESSEKLDEIVVVGYGTQRKKEVTGAVSVVGSETIEELKPTRVEQALQGQVAGVNITSPSGSPGAAPNIRIRGISTNGNNNPLILVDGNIIEDLSVINPSDIESINVLKDATAGIYGVRGANGVIIITTKSGRKETDYKFAFNAYTGFQTTTREIPMLNATEYALLANEAHAANGDALPFPSVGSLGVGTDWQNEVFETAPIFNVDFLVNKGTEKSTYSFGLSALDQDGIIGRDKSNFNRRTAKFNYSTEIIDGLTLTTSSLYTNTNRKTLAENALGSVLFNALNMPATSGVNEQAPTIGVGIEVINPIDQTEGTFNRVWVNKYAGSYSLKYKFLDYFSAETRYQHNYAVVKGKFFNPVADFGAGKVFNRNISSVNIFQQTFKDYLFDAILRYERKFNDVHDLKLMLGTSVNKSLGINDVNLTSDNVSGSDLNSAHIQSGARDNLALSNSPRQFSDSRLLSYFARVQYNYKGKYLLSAVVRRDGSSNFGPKNKFGYFTTASLGWVVSDENFMKDSEAIDFLKLRASYGVIGNDRIESFRFVSLLTGEATYVFNNQLTFGQALGAISNPEIRWEKQKPLDFGLDIGLFNKIDITVDYFSKETEDLLVNPEVSGLLGSNAPGSAVPLVNAGTVRNRGVEFSISYKEEVNDDFNFNINYNLTTLDNEVLFVGSDSGVVFGGTFGVGQENDISRMEAGFPIGYFYGLQTDGIFQTQAEVDAHATQTNAAPGDLRYIDRNGDGVISSDDRAYIGDPIPDVTMGLNFSLNYKNFDFNMYAFASMGNEIVRNYERNQPLTNRSVYYLDRWTGPGTSNSFPRVTTGATSNSLFSDFYVEDGSFVRLQNIQLGYSFGEEFLKRPGFDKLRVYLSASNLFTLTKYRGFDPTGSGGDPIGAGIDQGFYPSPKTFLLGINVNF
ncbi:TonB-dependent receptor [Pseudotenacibaculum sp. MALMAid0570]|uniref:SusC/RagA family TonB-linked outer membrane protein n=1 Tax=Pseudotenacibaculum sp. MALMAid0570 TaxID=3143938 RepID=UPI0032DFDFD9